MKQVPSSQIDALRHGIDSLIRRFKIAEVGSMDHSIRLNPIDLQAILFLANHPDSTASELGRYLGVVATTTTALVDRLVRRALVSRSRVESNRRVVHLNLTDDGRNQSAQIVETQNDHCRRMLEVLTPEERDHLVAAITKIAKSGS